IRRTISTATTAAMTKRTQATISGRSVEAKNLMATNSANAKMTISPRIQKNPQPVADFSLEGSWGEVVFSCGELVSSCGLMRLLPSHKKFSVVSNATVLLQPCEVLRQRYCSIQSNLKPVLCTSQSSPAEWDVRDGLIPPSASCVG